MSIMYIDSGIAPADLLKMLLTIRSQAPDTTVIINVVCDRFSYLTDALAWYDVLTMFSKDGKQPLNIEFHIKTHVSQFILIATAALPKDKVFVGEGVIVKWHEFNDYVHGTESAQEDMLRFYELAESSASNILEKAYDISIEDITTMIEGGTLWLEDDLMVAINAKSLEESPNFMSMPGKIELKPEPIVTIDSGFGSDVAAKFIREIDLMRVAGFKDLVIIINSPGGCVYSMLSMLGARARFGGNMKVIAIGLAASAGGFFLTSAPKGSRVASSNLVYMMHQFRGFNTRKGFGGNRWMGDKLVDIIAENSNLTRERVQELLLRDTFLSAREALEYGLIDAIIGDE